MADPAISDEPAPGAPEPDATRVGVRLATLGLALLLAPVAVAVTAGLLIALGVVDDPPYDRDIAIIALLSGRRVPAVLLVCGVWMLWRIWHMPTIAVDRHGIWLGAGGWAVMRWSEIGGVGVSDAERWQWRRRRDHPHGRMLEVYPATAEAARRFATFGPRRCLRYSGPPPILYRNLGDVRILVRLPGFEHRVAKVVRAIRRHRPDLWIGRQIRPNPEELRDHR